VYGELAAVTDRSGNPQASLPLYSKAFEGLKACEGAESRGALEQQDRMAGALVELGRAQEALPMIEGVMPPWRKIAGSSPDLAEPLNVLARAYLAVGQYEEAEKTAAELFAVQNGRVSSTDSRIGGGQLLWARALAGERQYPAALRHAEIAAKMLADGSTSESKQMDSQARQEILDLQKKLR